MVAFVGLREAGEFVRVRAPVEAPGIHNGPTHTCAVAVEVLRGGMRHDIRVPLDGPAVHGRGERVVHDEWHAVRMRGRGEAFDVEHGERRIRDSFAKNSLGVGAEGRFQFRVRAVGRHEGALQPHAPHRVGQQVVRAAIDGRACHHVVARAGNVEHGEKVRGLARRGKHAGRAAFKLGDFGGHRVVRGILQTRVEVARFLQVEQAAHVLARVKLPGGGLVDGQLARLAIAGTVAALHASGAERFSSVAHVVLLVARGKVRIIITTATRPVVTGSSDTALSDIRIVRSSDCSVS